MTIAFVHPHIAFLPEIDAYQIFFSTLGIKTIVVRPEEIKNIDTDIEWHFMGTDFSKKKKAIKIHEYASASTSPFGKEKNIAKKILNVAPDYRLFLNNYVEEQFDFKDEIPHGYRDMGIDDSFLKPLNNVKKEFDFIYVGSMNKERKTYLGPKQHLSLFGPYSNLRGRGSDGGGGKETHCKTCCRSQQCSTNKSKHINEKCKHVRNVNESM